MTCAWVSLIQVIPPRLEPIGARADRADMVAGVADGSAQAAEV